MVAPSLFTAIQGGVPPSADNLNTYTQSCDSVTQLRGFIGVTGQQVYIRGYVSVNDGGQGFFYWNSSGTGPDDNGLTNIVPSGSTAGCWTRLGVASGIYYYIVTVTSVLLNNSGSIIVAPATTGGQWRLKDIVVQANGTNFSSSGDRNIVLQDSSGTTILATFANAQLEALPTTGMRLGITGITANNISTPTVEGESVVLKYSGGTIDPSAGQIVCLITMELV